MTMSFSDLVSELSDTKVLALVFGGALASHAYFNRFEPTLFSSFRFAVTGSIAFIAALVTYSDRNALEVVGLYIKSAAVYLATLFSSISAYRLFFHPLRNIPGPTLPRLSKWWAMQSATKGRLGYDAKEFHGKYGPVVRMGPNWVDFQNPALIPKIYGSTPTQLIKGSWYDFGMGPGYDALQHVKDDNKHAQRRKIWDHGFSMKALSDYENDIQHRVSQLVKGVAKASKENPSHEVDMELWSSFFSFDVMGDLGFGEGFHMLENGKPHRFLELLKEAMRVSTPFSQVSWIAPLKFIMPTHPSELEFKNFTTSQVHKRILQGSKRRDLYSWLLAEDGDHSKKMSQIQLNSDAILIVVAGSDTTSSVLTWAWYYLVTNPQYYKRLQDEIDTDAEEGKALEPTRLSKLPFLNAVINETMRLTPPVPGGLQRRAPKGGMVLDGIYLPGGTTVTVGAYTVQTDPANWAPHPERFRPERWIDSDKEIAANKNAFIPFSYGPRSCPGKNLAMMEARLVLAALVPKYNAKLVPGFDRAKFENGVRDCFTIQSPALPLIMEPRVQKNA